jgi:hypothetical protein
MPDSLRYALRLRLVSAPVKTLYRYFIHFSSLRISYYYVSDPDKRILGNETDLGGSNRKFHLSRSCSQLISPVG